MLSAARRKLGSDTKTRDAGSTKRLAFIAGVGVLSLVLLFTLTDDPRSAPSRKTDTAGPVKVALLSPSQVKARPLSSYASLMRHDLFRPLVADQTRKRSSLLSPLLPNGLPPASLDGFGVIGSKQGTKDLQGWSYIGSVSIDGVQFALLQNGPSGDSGYFRTGERLGGYTVSRIDRETLVLSGPGIEPVRLAKTSGAVESTKRAGNDNAAPNPAQVAQASAASSDTPAQMDRAALQKAFTDGTLTPEQMQQMRNQFRGRRNRGGGNGG